MMRSLLALALSAVAWCSTVEASAQEATVRVVDVGGGLCVVAHTPDGYDVLYDAGHWQSSQCAAAVAELVEDDVLELVILSHSDSDHLGELPAILGAARAEIVIHTGSQRTDTATWRNAMSAIGAEVIDGATVINLGTWPLQSGHRIELGDAAVTFVAGWHEWDGDLSDSGAAPDESELRNVISIVARFEYGGRSVLLTGDTIGRRRADNANACRDAERWMVQNAASLIASDVLVAPHHGGDNGSARCFLDVVSPEWVIYSAGHAHEHPRTGAAERARASGIPYTRILRTDFGDDEGGDEWARGRRRNCEDPRGDDDVEITLHADGTAPEVRYRSARSGCVTP